MRTWKHLNDFVRGHQRRNGLFLLSGFCLFTAFISGWGGPSVPGSSNGMIRTGAILSAPSAQDSVNTEEFRKHQNKAFHVGEHLEFEIVFGVIKAGKATMSVPDTQWVNGRPCYHVTTTAESSEYLDALFRVRDRVESFIDMGGFFTWRFEKYIQEGRYRAERFDIYDPVDQRVFTKEDTFSVPRYTLDILSSFYYVRTIPLKVGKSFTIMNFSDGKIYPLKILVHAKDTIRVPAGVFRCIVVEPIIECECLVVQKGRVAIWLTDDERRLPVMMKSKVLIGSIDARLLAIHR